MCGTVQTARDFCIYPRPTPVSSPTSGFLSSLVTELTGCGSVLTPWSVVVRPGQTIRLTLYDFAVARQRSKTGGRSTSIHDEGGSQTHSCPAYAVLREPHSSTKSPRPGRNVTVCGGVARRSVVYVSVGNKVDVGLERADHVVYGAHYLIEYQGMYIVRHCDIGTWLASHKFSGETREFGGLRTNFWDSFLRHFTYRK